MSFHANKTYNTFLTDLLNILLPYDFQFIILGGDLNHKLEKLPDMSGYFGERADTENVPTMTGEGETNWNQIDQIIVYSKQQPEISDVQVDDVVFNEGEAIRKVVTINARRPEYCQNTAFFKQWIDGKNPASDHRLLSCTLNLPIEHNK